MSEHCETLVTHVGYGESEVSGLSLNMAASSQFFIRKQQSFCSVCALTHTEKKLAHKKVEEAEAAGK